MLVSINTYIPRFLQLKASFAIRFDPAYNHTKAGFCERSYLWVKSQYDIIGAFIQPKEREPSNGLRARELYGYTVCESERSPRPCHLSPIVGAGSVTSPILAIATYRFLADDASG
jgi:hypothetical protein